MADAVHGADHGVGAAEQFPESVGGLFPAAVVMNEFAAEFLGQDFVWETRDDRPPT